MNQAKEVIAQSKTAIEKSQFDEIKGLYERLTNITHQFSTELYKQSGTGNGGTSGAGGTGGGTPGGDEKAGTDAKKPDDVVDAEYKDVN